MNPARAPLGLTRANLDEHTLLVLHRGGAGNPDVLLVDADGGRAVVKDFSRRGPLLRGPLGRWLIRREVRAYHRLEGHASVPRLLGTIDRLALVVEHRGGARFSRRRPWTFSPAFGRQLKDAVLELHRRGVVHLDLRHRSNVRAGIDGRPVLIDFGSALTFRPGSLAARLCIPVLGIADRRAVAKWCRRFEDQSLGVSAGEASEIGRGASRPT